MPIAGSTSLVALYRRLCRPPIAIPLSLVQLAGRVAVAHVFWQSAQTKLASWPVTLQLFAFEYHLPLIDPAVAAPTRHRGRDHRRYCCFFGLFSRLGALMLLGVTATIQIFVYPQNWGEHLLWASAAAACILARGAGVVSLDYLASRLFARRR